MKTNKKDRTLELIIAAGDWELRFFSPPCLLRLAFFFPCALISSWTDKANKNAIYKRGSRTPALELFSLTQQLCASQRRLHRKTHTQIQTKHSPTWHLFLLSRQTIAVEINKGWGEGLILFSYVIKVNQIFFENNATVHFFFFLPHYPVTLTIELCCCRSG